jgi:hypothetical protein
MVLLFWAVKNIATNAITNIASDVALAEVKTLVKNMITKNVADNTARAVGKTATQKVSQTAEEYIINKGLPSLVNLNRRLAAEEIAGGHAFQKHAIEFGFQSRNQMALHIEKVMEQPTMMRYLSKGRCAFWDNATNSIIIRDPKSMDGGAIFIPKRGINYFLKEII